MVTSDIIELSFLLWQATFVGKERDTIEICQ